MMENTKNSNSIKAKNLVFYNPRPEDLVRDISSTRLKSRRFLTDESVKRPRVATDSFHDSKLGDSNSADDVLFSPTLPDTDSHNQHMRGHAFSDGKNRDLQRLPKTTKRLSELGRDSKTTTRGDQSVVSPVPKRAENNELIDDMLLKEGKSKLNEIYKTAHEFQSLNLNKDSERKKISRDGDRYKAAINKLSEDRMHLTATNMQSVRSDISHLFKNHDGKSPRHTSKTSLPNIKEQFKAKFTRLLNDINDKNLSPEKDYDFKPADRNPGKLFDNTVKSGRFFLNECSSAKRNQVFQNLHKDIKSVQTPLTQVIHESSSLISKERLLAASQSLSNFKSLLPNNDVISDDGYVGQLKKELPNIFTSNPSNRQEVLILGNWLITTIKGIQENKILNTKEKFLKADEIYNICFSELIRQVSFECIERGDLMMKIWKAYLGLSQDIIENLKDKEKDIIARADTEFNKVRETCQKLLDDKDEEVEKMKDEIKEKLKIITNQNERIERFDEDQLRNIQEAKLAKDGFQRLQKLYEAVRQEKEDMNFKLEKWKKNMEYRLSDSMMDLNGSRPDIGSESSIDQRERITVGGMYINRKQPILVEKETSADDFEEYLNQGKEPKTFAESETQTKLRLLDPRYNIILKGNQTLENILREEKAKTKLLREAELIENMEKGWTKSPRGASMSVLHDLRGRKGVDSMSRDDRPQIQERLTATANFLDVRDQPKTMSLSPRVSQGSRAQVAISDTSEDEEDSPRDLNHLEVRAKGATKRLSIKIPEQVIAGDRLNSSASQSVEKTSGKKKEFDYNEQNPRSDGRSNQAQSSSSKVRKASEGSIPKGAENEANYNEEGDYEDNTQRQKTKGRHAAGTKEGKKKRTGEVQASSQKKTEGRAQKAGDLRSQKSGENQMIRVGEGQAQRTGELQSQKSAENQMIRVAEGQVQTAEENITPKLGESHPQKARQGQAQRTGEVRVQKTGGNQTYRTTEGQTQRTDEVEAQTQRAGDTQTQKHTAFKTPQKSTKNRDVKRGELLKADSSAAPEDSSDGTHQEPTSSIRKKNIKISETGKLTMPKEYLTAKNSQFHYGERSESPAFRDVQNVLYEEAKSNPSDSDYTSSPTTQNNLRVPPDGLSEYTDDSPMVYMSESTKLQIIAEENVEPDGTKLLSDQDSRINKDSQKYSLKLSKISSTPRMEMLTSSGVMSTKNIAASADKNSRNSNTMHPNTNRNSNSHIGESRISKLKPGRTPNKTPLSQRATGVHKSPIRPEIIDDIAEMLMNHDTTTDNEDGGELIETSEQKVIRLLNLYKIEIKKQEDLQALNKALEKQLAMDGKTIGQLQELVQNLMKDFNQKDGIDETIKANINHAYKESMDVLIKSMDARTENISQIERLKPRIDRSPRSAALHNSPGRERRRLYEEQINLRISNISQYKGNFNDIGPLTGQKHSMTSKMSNNGQIVISKIRKGIESGKVKCEGSLSLKTLLKQITHFYYEKVFQGKENPALREQDMATFVYRQFITTYGFHKLGIHKFVRFILSVTKHAYLHRIHTFARIMGLLSPPLNYKLQQGKQFLGGIEFLVFDCMMGIPFYNQETSRNHYIPFVRAMELVRLFSEKVGSRARDEDILALRSELEKIKLNDTSNRNPSGVVDLDVFLEKLVAKYDQIISKLKDSFATLFLAADFFKEGKVKFGGFMALYKSVEHERGEDRRLEETFVNYCDIFGEEYIALSEVQFGALCFDLKLFSEQKVLSYLEVANENELERRLVELKENWIASLSPALERIIDEKKGVVPPEVVVRWHQVLRKMDQDVASENRCDLMASMIRYKILYSDVVTSFNSNTVQV